VVTMRSITQKWNCPMCTFENGVLDKSCLMCGTSQPLTPAGTPKDERSDEKQFVEAPGSGGGGGGGGGDEDMKVRDWTCDYCTTLNKGGSVKCDACGMKYKAPSVPAADATPAATTAPTAKLSASSNEREREKTIKEKKPPLSEDEKKAKFQEKKKWIELRKTFKRTERLHVAAQDDGQWVCSKCYRNNEAGDAICPGCDMPKTVSVTRQASAEDSALSAAGASGEGDGGVGIEDGVGQMKMSMGSEGAVGEQ